MNKKYCITTCFVLENKEKSFIKDSNIQVNIIPQKVKKELQKYFGDKKLDKLNIQLIKVKGTEEQIFNKMLRQLCQIFAMSKEPNNYIPLMKKLFKKYKIN